MKSYGLRSISTLRNIRPVYWLRDPVCLYVANCCLQPCCGHLLFCCGTKTQNLSLWPFIVFKRQFIIEGEKFQRVYPKYGRLPRKTERNEAKRRVARLSLKGGCSYPFFHWFSSIIKQPTTLCFMRKRERENTKCKMDLTYIHIFSCVCVYMCLLCWWKVHKEAVMMMFLYLG